MVERDPVKGVHQGKATVFIGNIEGKRIIRHGEGKPPACRPNASAPDKARRPRGSVNGTQHACIAARAASSGQGALNGYLRAPYPLFQYTRRRAR